MKIKTAVDAIKVRLETIPNSPAFLGVAESVSSTASQYSVVMPGAGTRYADRLDGTINAQEWQVGVMSVGRSVAACLALHDRSTALLSGWDLDSASLSSSILHELAGQTMMNSETVGADTRHSLTVFYSMSTTRG